MTRHVFTREESARGGLTTNEKKLAVFRSVRALIATIARFLDTWEEHKHPFSWVKTPSEVLRRPNVKAISAAVH